MKVSQQAEWVLNIENQSRISCTGLRSYLNSRTQCQPIKWNYSDIISWLTCDTILGQLISKMTNISWITKTASRDKETSSHSATTTLFLEQSRGREKQRERQQANNKHSYMCEKTWTNPGPKVEDPLETPHPWTMLWQPPPGTLGPQAATKSFTRTWDKVSHMSTFRTDANQHTELKIQWINNRRELTALNRQRTQQPVSYTHLTLPTNAEV